MWLVQAKTEDQRKTLLQWQNKVDFWEQLSPTSEKPVRIMVAPNHQNAFMTLLDKLKIKNELIIEDVEP